RQRPLHTAHPDQADDAHRDRPATVPRRGHQAHRRRTDLLRTQADRALRTGLQLCVPVAVSGNDAGTALPATPLYWAAAASVLRQGYSYACASARPSTQPAKRRSTRWALAVVRACQLMPSTGDGVWANVVVWSSASGPGVQG